MKKTDLAALEEAIASRETARYDLRLFVIGTTSHSARAIVNLRKLCDEYLRGRYDLEVVDISQQPALAKTEQILAAPTLVKKRPLPLRRIIGDMSQTAHVLSGLDLHEPAK